MAESPIRFGGITWSIVIFSALVQVSNLYAQHGLARDPVRPAPNLYGPVGRTFALGFIGTENRIYAAGSGKVVDRWDLERNPDGTVKSVITAESIRWPISRGDNGLILSAVADPAAQWLAFAGNSTFHKGDLALFGLTLNSIVNAIPSVDRPQRSQPPAEPDAIAHFLGAVRNLATNPSGTLLASVGNDGQIWLWTLPQAERLKPGANIRGEQIEAVAGQTSDLRPVVFAGERRLLYAVEGAVFNRGRSFQLQQYDTQQKVSRPYNRNVYARGITGLAAAGDGRVVASADADGSLHLQTENGHSMLAVFPVDPNHDEPRVAIRGLALSPNGSLLAVCGDATETKSYIQLRDTKTLELIAEYQSDGVQRHTVMAFDPRGRQLLINDDADECLLLWQVADAADNLLPAPLSPDNALRISGRGEVIDKIAFLTGNKNEPNSDYAFALQTRSGDGHVFNPRRPILKATDVAREIVQEPDAFAVGWIIKSTPKSITQRQTISVVQPGGVLLERDIDTSRFGEYRGHYCFLPGQDGQPFAIAIATQFKDLIHVLGLSPGLPLLRMFRAHGGEPISLSCSSDGRYLLSAARDQTVRFWSLDGLHGSSKPTPESIYGATFTRTAQGLRLSNVNPAGIAHARELKDGDVIVDVIFTADTGRVVLSGPNQLLSFLVNGHKLQDGLQVEPCFFEIVPQIIRDKNVSQTANFYPAWDALLTVVIDKNSEWVIFTADGYYNASPADGQNLFGWQLNRGRNGGIRFEKAAALQKEFEKPEVIERVLELGNVQDALAAAGFGQQADVAAVLRQLPELTIQSPAAQLLKAPAGSLIELRATLKTTSEVSPQQLELQAADNGRRLPDPDIRQESGVLQATWRIPSSLPLHKLSVGFKERGRDVVDSLQAVRELNIAGTLGVGQRGRLFLIGISGETYKGNVLKPLQFPHEDLNAIFDVLQKPSGYRFSSGLPSILRDDSVSRDQLTMEMDAVLQMVRERNNPNDLIVFSAFGHGEIYDQQFCFVPTTALLKSPAEGTSLTAGEQLANLGRRIPWRIIAERLNAAPCHVLWIVDACHSGAAGGDQAHKYAIRESLGILGLRQVLWSSSPKEVSMEHSAWKFESELSGHGAFTLALLEALHGEVRLSSNWQQLADKGDPVYMDLRTQYNLAGKEVAGLRSDKQLDVAELAAYLSRRVGKLTSGKQHPVASPFRTENGLSSAPTLVLDIYPDTN